MRDETALVRAAVAGDGAAFASLVDPYRRQLHVHCYRMLGSFDDAEDAVQETCVRAWRRLSTFEARATIRAWLYRIATRVCLDAIDRRKHDRMGNPADVPWLQPYPDRLLDAADLTIEKETIELVFLVVIQQLPPRQRAVLILRDVVGWTAEDTARALDMTVAGVKSALQRARGTLRLVLPARRDDWRPEPVGPGDTALLKRYIAALEHTDRTALADVLSADVRLTMPPEPVWYAGRDSIVSAIADVARAGDFGELRGVATGANRQPAVAWYRRRPAATAYEAFAIDVLRIEGGQITEITGFGEPAFRTFGLTDSFPAADPS